LTENPGIPNASFEIRSSGPWPLCNAKTGAPYALTRADKISPSVENLGRLVAINNEPAIYDFLWRRRLDGRAYDEEMAKSFFEWSSRGWAEQTHFAFVALDTTGNICAAADFKSNQRSRTELGYWVSQDHASLATPVVGVLKQMARMAGISVLFAHVRADNPRSATVLERNGFSETDAPEFSRGYERRTFELALDDF